jgi:hypothetical protein
MIVRAPARQSTPQAMTMPSVSRPVFSLLTKPKDLSNKLINGIPRINTNQAEIRYAKIILYLFLLK